MSTLLTSNVVAGPSTTDLERLKQQKPAGPEQEKARLRKVTKEFESLIFYEMLKNMRKTIPESSGAEGVFSGGLGKDIFTQMFDMQIAQKMARGGKGSVADILYQRLERLIDQRGAKPEIDVTKVPINSEFKAIKLNQSRFIESPRKFHEIKSSSDKELRPFSLSSGDSLDQKITSKYGHLIQKAARETSVDSSLIHSVIRVESAGNARAESRAGARGLMQLIDSTAKDYGVKRVFDPKENILGGSRYLRDLIDRFGDTRLALAAYNAGPANVEKYGGMPPFKETQDYVKRVLESVKTMRANNVIGSAKVSD